jgi:nitrogen fixation protein NifU and related proteins
VTSDLEELYREVILDHNKRPRNFRRLDGGRKVDGYNPLCGDKLTVYVRLDDDRIGDATFEGSGCAISKASASLMTDSVKGKTVAETGALFDRFHRMVTAPVGAPVEDLGKLSVFAGVPQFPARIKCAMLAWYALRAAAEARETVVSTE